MGVHLFRILLPFAFCLLPSLVACAPSKANTVTGAIIDLDAASLTSVRRFSLRDSDGYVWTFMASEQATDEEGRPLYASHLREHMTQGEQVIVDYRQDGNGLVATRVSH